MSRNHLPIVRAVVSALGRGVCFRNSGAGALIGSRLAAAELGRIVASRSGGSASPTGGRS